MSDFMPQRVHIFGASGSGTTTLGRQLAQRIQAVHLDTDNYYWLATDPPFTEKRAIPDRVRMILQDASGSENWVLSGSICSWGEPLLEHFTLAVFVYLEPDLRLQRLRQRELERYGDRIAVGGDMLEQHQEFMQWAASYDSASPPIRSLRMHEEWLQRLKCPVVRVDSREPTGALAEQVVNHLQLR